MGLSVSLALVFALGGQGAGCALGERERAPSAHVGSATEIAEIEAARHVQYESLQLTRLEPAVLARTEGRAVRHGRVLLLSLESGKRMPFESPGDPKDMECESAALGVCTYFTLIADLPSRHAFVVAELGYEYVDFRLVDDRTGQQLVLPGVPIFEPDGPKFLVICDAVNRSDRSIEVWRRDGDSGMREFRYNTSAETTLFETEFVRWDGDKIVLTRTDGADEAQRAARRWPAELVREPGGWRFHFRGPSNQ